MRKVSIVVPCYNEEENIEDFYNVVTKVIESEKSNYELIFIDDGSKDNTRKILKKLKSGKNYEIKSLIYSLS